jgi:hypothetical protein
VARKIGNAKDPKNAEYQRRSAENKKKKGLALIRNAWVSEQDVEYFKAAHKKSRRKQEEKYLKEIEEGL